MTIKQFAIENDLNGFGPRGVLDIVIVVESVSKKPILSIGPITRPDIPIYLNFWYLKDSSTAISFRDEYFQALRQECGFPLDEADKKRFPVFPATVWVPKTNCIVSTLNKLAAKYDEPGR